MAMWGLKNRSPHMKSKLPAFRSFKYNDSNFRVLDRNGEPWFVHNEVCKHLGIVNASDAASRLDDDEKDAIGITDIHDGSIVAPRSAVQRTTIINESGLYSLILRSMNIIDRKSTRLNSSH